MRKERKEQRVGYVEAIMGLVVVGNRETKATSQHKFRMSTGPGAPHKGKVDFAVLCGLECGLTCY